MRLMTTALILALLALPMGKAFAATNDLSVTINVTLSVTVDVVFVDAGSGGTTAKTWALAGSLGTSYGAVAASVKPQIHNNGAFSVNVTARVTDPSNWTSAAAIGTNQYTIVTTPATATSPLKASDGAQVYQSILPSASSLATDDISITLPNAVTHTTPGGGIVLNYVVTAAP